MAPVKKPAARLGRTYLRSWRDFKKKTQQEAADAINVSRELLSKIENSKSPYLQQHLEGLAVLYETVPANLLGRNPLEPEPRIRAVDEILSFLNRIDGLKQDNVSVLLAMIQGFQQANAAQPSQDRPGDLSEPATPRRESTSLR